MPPSQLQIATSALQRLVKEEASYHKEQESQEQRIAKLEKSTDDPDGNRDFILKQEVRWDVHDTFSLSLWRGLNPGLLDGWMRQRTIHRLANFAPPFLFFQKKALDETKAVFPNLRDRIANAREKLQAQLVRF